MEVSRIINVNLMNEEEILYQNNNTIISTNNRTLEVALIITNNRILIFGDVTRETYKEVLRVGRSIQIIPKYELIFERNINELHYVKYEGNMNVISVDENKLVIFDVNLQNYFKL